MAAREIDTRSDPYNFKGVFEADSQGVRLSQTHTSTMESVTVALLRDRHDMQRWISSRSELSEHAYEFGQIVLCSFYQLLTTTYTCQAVVSRLDRESERGVLVL